MTSGGQDQAPRQFRHRVRIAPAFTKGDDDAVAGTGVEIKMGSLPTRLHDQLECWEPRQKWLGDRRAFPNKDQGISLLEAGRKRFNVLRVIVIHGHLVTCKCLKTGKVPHGILVVVGNNYSHTFSCPLKKYLLLIGMVSDCF